MNPPDVQKPIEFYFDLMSPYGYLGVSEIERVAAANGRTLDWKPVLIGITILKIMGAKGLPATPLKGPYSAADAVRIAKLLGIPFRHHGFERVSSVPSMRAFLWLKEKDPLLAVVFAKRIYERLWVNGEDISKPEIVAQVGAAVGVDSRELLAAIESPGIKQKLFDAVDQAVAKGVFGVPFVIADGEPFWGGDRVPMLDHWLKYHSWEPQPKL